MQARWKQASQQVSMGRQEKKPKLKVPELRAELKRLGEDTKGSKAELQERLGNCQAIVNFENAESLDNTIDLSSDEEIDGTIARDYVNDPDAYKDLPMKKRPREGCECYTCRGTVFRMDHETGIVAAATSICATIRLGCSISRDDLKTFTRDVELGVFINGAVYNPRRCPAVQIATSHPETSVNLYSCEGGPAKMVCLGARTKAQARTALRRVSRQVQLTCAPDAEFLEFKISNYIMSGDLKFQVRLSELLKTLNADSNQHQRTENLANFEPELSPKLSYHMKDPVDIKLDIFHTGKVNILRCLGREDLIKAFDFLWPMLCRHRVEDTPPVYGGDDQIQQPQGQMQPPPQIVIKTETPIPQVQAPRQPQLAVPLPAPVAGTAMAPPPMVSQSPAYAGQSPAYAGPSPATAAALGFSGGGPSPAYAGPSPATAAALGLPGASPTFGAKDVKDQVRDDFDELLDLL